MIENPDGIRVHSIDPKQFFATEGCQIDDFCQLLESGEGVLGSLDIESSEEFGTIARGVYAGFAAGEFGARCFIPRHVIEFRKGEDRAAVIICFQCDFAVPVPHAEDGRSKRFFHDKTGLSARLNARLRAAGIPIAD